MVETRSHHSRTDVRIGSVLWENGAEVGGEKDPIRGRDILFTRKIASDPRGVQGSKVSVDRDSSVAGRTKVGGKYPDTLILKIHN